MTLAITFYDGIKYHRMDFINRDADLIGNGVVTTTEFPVTFPATPNMTVNVGQGRAWVDGYRISNDSSVVTLTVTAADATNPRIDLIEIGHDDVNQVPSLKIKTGVPAAQPVAPGADPGYIGLWQISVAANATSITNSNMTDIRALMPLNVSGTQIQYNGVAGLSQANTFTQVQTAAGWVATNGQTPLKIPMLSAIPTAIGAADTLIVVNNGSVPNWYRSDGTEWVNMAPPLQPATASTLGGVKIGSGLTVTADGTISAPQQYTLPAATASTLGGVKIGANVSVATDGTISVAAPYALPTASASTLGGVKIGSGINIASGVISVTPYTLPVATSSVLGGVKQGSNITIAADGTISGNAPYTLPTASASTLGGVKIGSGINIASGVISVTPYTLPAATTSTLGGVKAGTGLNVAGDGTLSAAGTTWSSFTQTASAGQTTVTFPTGSYSPGTNTVFLFIRGVYQKSGSAYTETNSTTLTLAQALTGGEEIDVLYATNLASVPAANMTPATTSALGGIIVGSGLSVTTGGVLSNAYALPVATASVLGGVKQGSGVTIAADGTLSTTAYTLPTASTSVIGGVEVSQATGSTPVAIARVANVQEQTLADTTLDTVMTFTPTTDGTFTIPLYYRVLTAATNVTIQITYTSAGGAQTETPVNNISMSPGEYGAGPYVINAKAGNAITVKVQAGTANQVIVSGSILGV